MPLSRKLAHLVQKGSVTIDDLVSALRTYNLLSLLPSVLTALKQTAKSGSLHDTIRIESPFEMKEETITHIKRIVGNDLAPHDITINPQLLAGFKARFRGRLYDGSAERIIKQLTTN